MLFEKIHSEIVWGYHFDLSYIDAHLEKKKTEVTCIDYVRSGCPGMLSVSYPEFFVGGGTPVYIATKYLSGTGRAFTMVGRALPVKFLEFKVSRLA